MPPEPAATPCARRAFLRTAGRWLAGGLLAVLAAPLAARSRRGGRLTGQDCTGNGVCRGCRELAACGLPQALSARRAGVGGPAAGPVR